MRRTRLTLSAIALTSLILTACSDDGAQDGDQPSAPPVAESTAQTTEAAPSDGDSSGAESTGAQSTEAESTEAESTDAESDASSSPAPTSGATDSPAPSDSASAPESASASQSAPESAAAPETVTVTESAAAPDPVAAPSTATVTEAPKDPMAQFDSIEFITPSENVGCRLDDEGVRCVIDETEFPASMEPSGCAHGLSIQGTQRPEWTCGGQATSFGLTNDGGAWADASPVGEVRSIRGTSYTVLEYGQTVSFAGTTCTSKNTGIECERSTGGHGFKLAKKTYQVW